MTLRDGPRHGIRGGFVPNGWQPVGFPSSPIVPSIAAPLTLRLRSKRRLSGSSLPFFNGLSGCTQREVIVVNLAIDRGQIHVRLGSMCDAFGFQLPGFLAIDEDLHDVAFDPDP